MATPDRSMMTDDEREALIVRLSAVIETATTDAFTAASQMNVTASEDAATRQDVAEAEAVRDLVIAALRCPEPSPPPLGAWVYGPCDRGGWLPRGGMKIDDKSRADAAEPRTGRAKDVLVLLEDAIDNIDYPGADTLEWIAKAKEYAAALARFASVPPLSERRPDGSSWAV